MYTLLVILIVIAAISLILIVLIQESKGGGLASNFSAQNNLLGVRKTTDVVEKTTWGLALAMVVISVACAYVAPKASTDQSVFEGSAQQTEQTNPATTPGFGANANPAEGATEEATPVKEGAKTTDAETPAEDAAPVN